MPTQPKVPEEASPEPTEVEVLKAIWVTLNDQNALLAEQNRLLKAIEFNTDLSLSGG